MHVLSQGFVGESLAGVDTAGADIDEAFHRKLAGQVE